MTSSIFKEVSTTKIAYFKILVGLFFRLKHTPSLMERPQRVCIATGIEEGACSTIGAMLAVVFIADGGAVMSS